MTDAQLIDSLGGSSKVAELLNYDKGRGGVQRVQNWITRGIPSDVKLAHPNIFMRGATPISSRDQGEPTTEVA